MTPSPADPPTSPCVASPPASRAEVQRAEVHRAEVHRAEVHLHPADVELASAGLWAAGAQGVWDRGGGELTAWFAARVGFVGLPGLADATVAWQVEQPRDWQAAWKATIAPVHAGSTVVVPSWLADEHTPEPGELTLVLDPGQAFGTGHHATTTLCLEALERLDLRGASVADVGCGTGVLAIAAARRGAGKVLAVDVDPDAVEVTRANAAHNHAEVEARAGSVDTLASPVDVVVANLVTDTLVALAPALVAATRHTLVVSGIDAQRQDLVVAALSASGARIVAAEERDGWAVLTAVPTSAVPTAAGATSPTGATGATSATGDRDERSAAPGRDQPRSRAARSA